jgi:hypothetical protein
MLSLFMFTISLGFTFVALTQYLDLKHAEVGVVEERLSSLMVMDELVGTPGWLGGRTDWESSVSTVDLEEKVNDQGFSLGLRENDRFRDYRIVVPGSSDSLMQTASSGTISSAVESLGESGVICIEIQEPFTVSFIVNTSVNPSMIVAEAADNATTRAGSFFVGSPIDVLVTDKRADGRLRYDTAVIGGEVTREGSKVSLAGRNFTVEKIDQERVLLSGRVQAGYLLPRLDGYHLGLALAEMTAAGIKFQMYEDLVSGASSSLEYTLLSQRSDKFAGQATELSLKKIEALAAYVSYDTAKAALGIRQDFHLAIVRDRDGAAILDYGMVTPADTEKTEREVQLGGARHTIVVHLW